MNYAMDLLGEGYGSHRNVVRGQWMNYVMGLLEEGYGAHRNVVSG